MLLSERWSNRIERREYPKDEKIDFAPVLVPNIDNARIRYSISLLSKHEKSVLLIGEAVIITIYLKHFDNGKH